MAGEVFVKHVSCKTSSCIRNGNASEKKKKRTKKRATLSVASHGAIVRSLNFAL